MKLHRRNFLQGAAGAAALSGLPNVSRAQRITKDLVADFGAVGDGVTDDARAFRAFNDWAREQTMPITLTLGTGTRTFLLGSGDPGGRGFTGAARGNSPCFRVKVPLTISGNGPDQTTLLGISRFLPPGWQGREVGISFRGGYSLLTGLSHVLHPLRRWTARLATVNKGSTTLQCLNRGEADQFIVNTWAMIGGINLFNTSAYGWPPNPYFFEYVFITGIDSTTGVITIQDPLTDTYKQNWAAYYQAVAGRTHDSGGPATLFALGQDWNIDVTIQNLTVNNPAGQTYFDGRSVKFINVTDAGAPPGAPSDFSGGLCPSTNKFVSFTNCDLSSFQMEYDKMVEECVFDNTKFNIFMQSANKHLTIKNGCAIRQLQGTGRFTNLSDSTVAIFKLGPVGFGIAETCTSTNVTLTNRGNPDIAQAQFSAGGVTDPGMITSTGVDIDYTMADGIIKAPKAGMAYPLHWAIPGGWCQFVGSVNPSPNGQFWQVVDQWEDADYVYVHTTLPGGFPPWGPGIRIKSHACPNVTFINCTGHEDIVRLSAAYAAGYGGKPYGTYLSRSFNGSNLGTFIAGSVMPASTPMLGKLVSYKFDVTTPYTGNNNPLWWRVGAPFGGHAILPDLTTRVDFMPVIDLRTAGTRIMTPEGTTGAQPGDSGLTLVDPNEWLSNVIMGFAAAPPDITADFAANPSVGPQVTIELITDQEIT